MTETGTKLGVDAPMPVRKRTGPYTAMLFTEENAHAVIEWLGRACVRKHGHVDGRIFDISVATGAYVVATGGRQSAHVSPGDWIVRDPWDHFEVLTEDEFHGEWDPDVR